MDTSVAAAAAAAAAAATSVGGGTDGSNNNNGEYHFIYTDQDILCVSKSQARNPNILNHPGNQRYYQILGKYCTAYQVAKEQQQQEQQSGGNGSNQSSIRQAIVRQMLDEVQSNGARFLTNQGKTNPTNNPNQWVELPTPRIKMKLRDALAKFKATKLTTNNNATATNNNNNNIATQLTPIGTAAASIPSAASVAASVAALGDHHDTMEGSGYYDLLQPPQHQQQHLHHQQLHQHQNQHQNQNQHHHLLHDNNSNVFSSPILPTTTNTSTNHNNHNLNHNMTTTTTNYDELASMSMMTMMITDNDILCRTSGSRKNHPGNQRYLEILKQYRNEYQAAPKGSTERQNLLQRVVEEIQSNGARFMAPASGLEGAGLDDDNEDDNGIDDDGHPITTTLWVEVDRAKVRTKVSNSLLVVPGGGSGSGSGGGVGGGTGESSP